jgi:hypothetical protein
MSFESPDTWFLILRSALIVAAFFVFARALLVSRRDTAVGFAQLAAQHTQALEQVQRLSAELKEIHSQVRELTLPSPVASHRLRAVAEPEFVPPPQPTAPQMPVRGYEMAIRMARGGASVEEIAESCGTTRPEARLLRRLHNASGADAA